MFYLLEPTIIVSEALSLLLYKNNNNDTCLRIAQYLIFLLYQIHYYLPLLYHYNNLVIKSLGGSRNFDSFHFLVT